jgi:hypothetical protein
MGQITSKNKRHQESTTIQDKQSNMFIGSTLHKSLYKFDLFVRNDFDKIEQQAKLLIDNEQYKDATSRKKMSQTKI